QGWDIAKDDGIYTSAPITVSASEPNATITARVIDGLGNSWQANLTVPVDNTAPGFLSTRVAYPSNQSYATEGQTVTVTIETGAADISSALLDCRSLGAGVTTLSASPSDNGNWSSQCTLTNTSQAGSINITANLTDLAGNRNGTAITIILDSEAPEAPGDLQVADAPYDTDGTVSLTWAPSSSSDVVSYNVYRSDVTPVQIIAGNLLKTSTTNSTTDSASSGTYYWAITALDSAGLESAASNEANTTITSASPRIQDIQVRYPGSQSKAKNGDTVRVMATVTASVELANVTVNASGIASITDQGIFSAYDYGTLGDDVLGDDVYTASITLNGTSGTANASVAITANDTASLTTTRNMTVLYDNIAPNVTVLVVSSGATGFSQTHENYTASRTVTVQANYTDDSGILTCAFANEDGSFTAEESCTSAKDWLLSAGDGEKTVFVRVMDVAGNNATANDTIILNQTGVGLDVTPPSAPTVLDDGHYTNGNSSLHFTWSGASDHESDLLHLPLTYRYRLYDTNGSWIHSSWQDGQSAAAVTITTDLENGHNYTLAVQAINSVGLNSSTAWSDGIIVDIDPPFAPKLSSPTHPTETNWTNANEPLFLFNSSDATSSIAAYSYLLDQSALTTPDLIPEQGSNITFAAVDDGIYYFHVMARDNASNWGSASHYTIRVDTSAPSIPQMNGSVFANTTNVTITWFASSDISGIAGYYLEVGSTSGGNDTFAADVDNVTSYNVDLSAAGDYFARVKARNGAGIWSAWSSSVSAIADTTAPAPWSIKPNATVVSRSVIIVAKTTENATCYQKRDIFAYTNFTITGTTYHEVRVTVENLSQEYTYSIKCVDAVGNANVSTIAFTPESTSPDAVTVANVTGYVGQLARFNITVSASGAVLG
ncbi:hypothetical protein COY28_04830, partial [Candidatus Woesearchaeota archaeon CG_4_10_14_0_2_um_filter_57_5]